MNRVFFVLLAFVLQIPAAAFGQATANVTPLPRAHAHNDYEHKRPLLDALDNGFASVEADVFLVDGKLLVAHNRKDVRPERTLESLYLAPLAARVRANRNRRVYKNSDLSLLLLVDIKADGEAVYGTLRGTLQRYADILTRWENNKERRGAVTIVLSGDRPIETVRRENTRFVGIDGRLSDLDDATATPALFPLISQNWGAISNWYGSETSGAFPDADRLKLAAIVAKAHARGHKLRFWATGNSPILWRALHDAGVDFLNADDLPGLRAVLLPLSDKTTAPVVPSKLLHRFRNIFWHAQQLIFS